MSDKSVVCSRDELKEDVIKILGNPTIENFFAEMDTCQNTLDVWSEVEVDEKLAVTTKYDSLKKIHFDKRNKLIERIPNFWITAIQNHPDLSLLIDNNEVRDIFRYVTKIDMNLIKGGHLTMKIFFQENPYLENEVLVKEFTVGDNEEKISKTTDIVWKKNIKSDQEKLIGSRKRKLNEEQNFFDWFSAENANDDFTSTHFYAIWETPLSCYKMDQIDESGEEEEMDQSDDDEDY